MFNQLTKIRGDFHQPRGGGTSDEQGELDTRVQDRHFTSLCGEHRSHRSMTFHIYITTTVTQTQKKKTHINASPIHSINASYIHSLLNAPSIHPINASYTHSPVNASPIHLKRIVHSSHKRIVHLFDCKRIAHSLLKTHRIFSSKKKNQGAPSLGLHSRVWHMTNKHTNNRTWQ